MKILSFSFNLKGSAGSGRSHIAHCSPRQASANRIVVLHFYTAVYEKYTSISPTEIFYVHCASTMQLRGDQLQKLSTQEQQRDVLINSQLNFGYEHQ